MERLYRTRGNGNAAICQNCGRRSSLISRALGLCLDCIRTEFARVRPLIQKAHGQSREPFGLPPEPPRDATGLLCRICLNECRIPLGGRGYCGLRVNKGDTHLEGATAWRGNASWYYDPLPTNCVADWVCPGGTGAGYPRFAYTDGPERGHRNLAVFYQACSFDCLFCQNWHYRDAATMSSRVDASAVAGAVDDQTACICFFGGDPSPQLPHAIRVARLAVQRNQSRILRICWETNGSMHPGLLKQAARLSFDSGGCIKFDLKAWDEGLHMALCGVSNRRTVSNFTSLAEYVTRRPVPPFLIASTLLVPGYVDAREVADIAAFISSLSPDIPYALLAFHPQFAMGDLPSTSRRHAAECLEAARGQGLTNVRLGNVHLLGDDY